MQTQTYQTDTIPRLKRILTNAVSQLDAFERRGMPECVIDMQRDHIAHISARLEEARQQRADQ